MGKSMKIVIILLFGILSYLIVLIPGYFLFFSEGTDIFPNKDINKISSEDSDNKAKQLPLKNPGDEPPPK